MENGDSYLFERMRTKVSAWLSWTKILQLNNSGFQHIIFFLLNILPAKCHCLLLDFKCQQIFFVCIANWRRQVENPMFILFTTLHFLWDFFHESHDPICFPFLSALEKMKWLKDAGRSIVQQKLLNQYLQIEDALVRLDTNPITIFFFQLEFEGCVNLSGRADFPWHYSAWHRLLCASFCRHLFWPFSW